jgi:hypothetical protein
MTAALLVFSARSRPLVLFCDHSAPSTARWPLAPQHQDFGGGPCSSQRATSRSSCTRRSPSRPAHHLTLLPASRRSPSAPPRAPSSKPPRNRGQAAGLQPPEPRQSRTSCSRRSLVPAMIPPSRRSCAAAAAGRLDGHELALARRDTTAPERST